LRRAYSRGDARRVIRQLRGVARRVIRCDGDAASLIADRSVSRRAWRRAVSLAGVLHRHGGSSDATVMRGASSRAAVSAGGERGDARRAWRRAASGPTAAARATAARATAVASASSAGAG
jgi:hypothetical protein